MVNGEDLRALARETGLNYQTLYRHKRYHLPRLLVKAEAAREISSAGYLLGRIRELIDDLDRLRRGARSRQERPLRIKTIEALAARFEFLLRVGVELAAAGRREACMTEEEFSRMIEAHLAVHPEVIEKYLATRGPQRLTS
jgi:hypothetical protein